MEIINYYGCVKCQDWHYKELTPNLYQKHLYFQEKHGTKELTFTDHETKALWLAKVQDKYFKDIEANNV